MSAAYRRPHVTDEYSGIESHGLGARLAAEHKEAIEHLPLCAQNMLNHDSTFVREAGVVVAHAYDKGLDMATRLADSECTPVRVLGVVGVVGFSLMLSGNDV